MKRLATLLFLMLFSLTSSTGIALSQNWKEAFQGSYKLMLADGDLVEFDINSNLEVLVWRWNQKDSRNLVLMDISVKAGDDLLTFTANFQIHNLTKEVNMTLVVKESNKDAVLFNGAEDTELHKRIHRAGWHKIIPHLE